ncbi:MAG: pilin [Candidatus Electrothrix sp. AW5]|nr:pilin [Candidatus Electrothrix gigas]
MKKQIRQQGFTLIELMIVIAILSILSSIAMPNFQDRIIRAQIQEALELTKTLKPAIMEFQATQNRFPKNNEEAGIPKPEHLIGNFVTGITVADGAVHIKLGNKINAHAEGKMLTIRPAIVAAHPSSPLSWLCGYARPVEGMEAVGENQTSVPENYLPLSCRSW